MSFIQVRQKSIKSFRSFFLPFFAMQYYSYACGHPWFCLLVHVLCWWWCMGLCVFVYFVFIFAFNLFLFQIFNVASTSGFPTLDDRSLLQFRAVRKALKLCDLACWHTHTQKNVYNLAFSRTYFKIHCFRSSIGVWKRIKLNPLSIYAQGQIHFEFLNTRAKVRVAVWESTAAYLKET